MVGWMSLCEATENKLERKLKQKERDFLKWLYEQHQNELREQMNQGEYIK